MINVLDRFIRLDWQLPSLPLGALALPLVEVIRGLLELLAFLLPLEGAQLHDLLDPVSGLHLLFTHVLPLHLQFLLLTLPSVFALAVDCAISFHLTLYQVVARGLMIVLVRIQVPHDLVSGEALLLKLVEHLLIVELMRVAYYEALGLADGLVILLEPLVVSNVGRCESEGGLMNHYLTDEVFGVCADELWDLVIALQYLLVELGGVWFLEREESTDESEQDNAAGPAVDLRPYIVLASNHLWSGIARRATRRLEGLVVLEGVG